MALGAQQTDVWRMSWPEGAWPSLAGVIIGLAVAIPASNVLASILCGVQPLDFRTLCSVTLMMLVVTLGAAYLPSPAGYDDRSDVSFTS